MKEKNDMYLELYQEILRDKKKKKKYLQVRILVVVTIIILAVVSILFNGQLELFFVIVCIVGLAITAKNILPLGKVPDLTEEEIVLLAKKKLRQSLIEKAVLESEISELKEIVHEKDGAFINTEIYMIGEQTPGFPVWFFFFSGRFHRFFLDLSYRESYQNRA